jgi:hypothetical protein
MRAHRAPVLDRGADVVEHLGDALRHRAQPIGRLRHDLGAQERFALGGFVLGVARQGGLGVAVAVAAHRDDGMDDEMGDKPLARQFGGERIDQERHVVGGRLDHRARAFPAVGFRVRVVGAHQRLAGGTLLGEAPMGERGGEQVFRRNVDEVALGDVGVIAGEERLQRRGFLRAQALFRLGREPGREIGMKPIAIFRHLAPPSCVSPPGDGPDSGANSPLGITITPALF